MKTSTLFSTWLFSAVALLAATTANPLATPATKPKPDAPAPTAFHEVERGANHKVWSRESYEKTSDGQIITHRHEYTELASGLHYQDKQGRWLETQEKIEVFPGGSIARRGPHQVIFANNLNTAGAIDMQTPDGKRLRSNVLGLMYHDTATGEAVLIARLQDTEGQLVADNQVVYPDAFEGVKADVRYTYSRGGFEQDVILREQIPAPEAYGLGSDTTELEVFTEFIEPPAARVREQQREGAALAADQEVGWGAVNLGRGKAFNLGTEEPPTPVVKRYVTIQGRNFLLEKVAVKAIQSALSKLPEQAAIGKRLPLLASKNPELPATPKAPAEAKPMKLALGAMPTQGYVLDYVALTSALTNYTFKSDTTYYISGSLNAYGTNTFEGGTVLKFATNGTLVLTTGPVAPGLNWQGSAYRPVVFTAKDDNTVGESLGSGTPVGYYGTFVLVNFTPVNPITGLRIAYAKTAIYFGGAGAKFYQLQLVNCQNGLNLGGANVFLGNALFANTKTNLLYYGGSTVTAQNTTFSGSAWLATAPASQAGNFLALTNCLLANVTNLISGLLVSTNGNYNGFYNTPYLASLAPIAFTNTFYPFRKVGGGDYYLTNGVGFRTVGTTNVDATLLAQLRQKTTYPPMAYTNISFYTPTTYSPQAARDTNAALDLGYHYDPLDYTFGGCHVYTNITFTAGTAVGWFRTTSGWNHAGQGIHLGDKQVCTFNGTATAPCYWVRLNTVQEQDRTAGYGPGGVTGWADQYAQDVTRSPILNLNWTKCSLMGTEPGSYFRDDYGYLTVRGTACEFGAGGAGGYGTSLYFTNTLFDRTYFCNVQGWPGNAVVARNCTFRGGMIQMTTAGVIPVTIQNCALDGTSVSLSGSAINSSYATYGYNAYTNATNPFPFGGNNVVMPNGFNWQKSWFGSYYLPTNSPLINAGSTTADLTGLYHFTTQTNQVKDAASQVDIGYHYLAADAYGNPMDTDGDGLPDYVEDPNGNGLFDAGDLSNWGIGSFNGLSTGNGLSVFTPLK